MTDNTGAPTPPQETSAAPQPYTPIVPLSIDQQILQALQQIGATLACIEGRLAPPQTTEGNDTHHKHKKHGGK